MLAYSSATTPLDGCARTAMLLDTAIAGSRCICKTADTPDLLDLRRVPAIAWSSHCDRSYALSLLLSTLAGLQCVMAAGLDFGGLHIGNKAPLEAIAQALLILGDLVRQLVAGDDNLSLGVVKGIWG